MNRYEQQLASYATQVNDALRERLHFDRELRQIVVVDAMRHSLLDAGKRLRAAMVLEFGRLTHASREGAMALACAIEMIHAYSLIHDDLPCMDDDDFRRGKPSCHKAFGEANALLAGDGLLTLAFETAADAPLSDVQRVEAVRTLAKAAGVRGMLGGQVIDLGCEGKPVDLETLNTLYALKTGALLRASVHGRLAVMFPMIASLQELRCARKLLGEARAELEAEGTGTASVEVGVMIETPAAAVLSDLLAREADFFSIGTNDLTQYTLAADRMNERIAGYYRPADPAVLRLMKLTAENARKNGVWTGVCGESAADPALIPLYLAMGITELSMSPAALPEARERVRSLDMEEARAALARALGEVE